MIKLQKIDITGELSWSSHSSLALLTPSVSHRPPSAPVRVGPPLRAALITLLLFQALVMGQLSVRGRIVDDLTHQGIGGVRVELVNKIAKGVAMTVSDGRGIFEFLDPPDGEFSLDAGKQNYFLLSEIGQGVTVTISGSSEIDLGDQVLTAHRTISGTVRTREGEPVSGAEVHVMQFRGGKPSRARFIKPMQTNERGEFRLEQLLPRRYLVFAYAVTQMGATVPASILMPVFYPNLSGPDESGALDLRGIREASAPIFLEKKTGIVVEGTIATTPSIAAGSDALVGLLVAGIPSDRPVIVVRTRVGDPFLLGPVPRGDYFLWTSWGRPAPGQPQASGVDISRLSVGTEPIRGLKIVIPKPTILTGKIEIEEVKLVSAGQSFKTSSGTSPASNIVLQFEAPKSALPVTLTVRTNDKGEFQVPGVDPAEDYAFSPGDSWPADSYIAQFTQNDKTPPAGPGWTTGGSGSVHILLKKDGGNIFGKAKDNDHQASNAFVVLAPKDRQVSYWYKTTTTAADGSFRFFEIAPGEYDLFALDRNDEDNFLDDAYLQRFSNQSVRVELRPFGDASVELALAHVGAN